MNTNKRKQQNPKKRFKSFKTLKSCGIGIVPIPLNIGHQPKNLKMTTKYSDVVVSGTTITSAGTVTPLTNIAQGVTVNQRVGDSALLEALFLNFDVNVANSDVFTTSRILVFQWLVNTALHVPVIADILQTASTLSMVNFNTSNQYIVLLDELIFQSGLATAPTATSLVGRSHAISVSSAKKRLEWNAAVTTGSNQIFILYISDSAIAPFPGLNYTSRVLFDESI